MSEIVAVDIGGTHARFALARLEGVRVVALTQETTLRTAGYASLQTACQAFVALIDRPPPRAAGLAVAGPVEGEELHLTNSPWTIRPALIPETLGFDRYVLVNDFGAVGHAVDQLAPACFRHIAGPERDLPAEGVVSIVGPGTGLGVAQLVRRDGRALVVETEGGHIDFAPLDTVEDAILASLRLRHRRVSVERMASGPGLANIYAALADIEGRPVATLDDVTLWTRALDGGDALASAAFERFCAILGAVAGDIALAQGAQAVVVAGGLGLRLADRLASSGFAARFRAKGRFEARMAAIPVKLLTHPQPGLFGAASAFAARFGG